MRHCGGRLLRKRTGAANPPTPRHVSGRPGERCACVMSGRHPPAVCLFPKAVSVTSVTSVVSVVSVTSVTSVVSAWPFSPLLVFDCIDCIDCIAARLQGVHQAVTSCDEAFRRGKRRPYLPCELRGRGRRTAGLSLVARGEDRPACRVCVAGSRAQLCRADAGRHLAAGLDAPVHLRVDHCRAGAGAPPRGSLGVPVGDRGHRDQDADVHADLFGVHK
mmetsp:Transcript_1238/g.4022  ORF Transcript_1238/g.4022 Transcript_1238/m.4022 type:complete len:218 (+) Transcript_1238:197-850(+)